MAIPGKRCPPVPPPAIMTLISPSHHRDEEIEPNVQNHPL
jgi:hypothetical protein